MIHLHRAFSIALALSLYPLASAMAAGVPQTNVVNPALVATLSAAFSARTPAYSGMCPAALNFSGTITGAPNQAVSYAFTRTIHGVATSTLPVNASLDASGQLKVADALSVNASGAGSDELDVWPGAIKAQAAFTATCRSIAVPRSGVMPAIVGPGGFVVDGVSQAAYQYGTPDLSRCTGDPLKRWATGAIANLKAGFTGEKAYMQERDAYGSASAIGFSPEVPDIFCTQFVITVGHYISGAHAIPLAASTFFITAHYIHGGPMYCITDISGAGHGAGEPGVSQAGGPILTPEQCAALPVWTAPPSMPMVVPAPYVR